MGKADAAARMTRYANGLYLKIEQRVRHVRPRSFIFHEADDFISPFWVCFGFVLENVETWKRFTWLRSGDCQEFKAVQDLKQWNAINIILCFFA